MSICLMVICMNNYNISTGNCGEYFVAAELERRGFTAAVPMSNTKDFDILAINRENNKQIAIQVKTTKYKRKEWTLSSKNENIYEKNIFYVFVSLNELDNPEYHIVPSNIVAKEIKQSHSEWLNTLGRKGQKHKDNPIRKFNDFNDKYLNNWNCLKGD